MRNSQQSSLGPSEAAGADVTRVGAAARSCPVGGFGLRGGRTMVRRVTVVLGFTRGSQGEIRARTHEEVHHVLLALSVVHPYGLHRCQGFLPLLVGAQVLRRRRWFHASDSRGGGGPLPGRGVRTAGCAVCCAIFVTWPLHA